jgi:hypothetical protein
MYVLVAPTPSGAMAAALSRSSAFFIIVLLMQRSYSSCRALCGAFRRGARARFADNRNARVHLFHTHKKHKEDTSNPNDW